MPEYFGTKTGRISSKSPRPIYEVARDIHDNWAAVYSDRTNVPVFVRRAKPYLDALRYISTPADMYGLEYGDMIVAHFLSAAVPWRGEVARSTKAELNEHLERYNNRKES